jgi:hypothetical protein
MKQFLPKLFVFLFSITLLNAQVTKTETPSWVNIITPPYQTKVDEGSISNGYYYIMLDNQFHLEKKVEYIHYAIKVLSDAGVQEVSEISVDFDPSYQKVEFHHIQIIRDNKKVQQLSKVQIKQIQRETDLESKIYDGSKTAFIALNDIRKGDIIEYDYSLIGFNPVLGDKFFQRVGVGFSQPIPLLNFRILANKNRIFKSKTIGKKSISLKTRFSGELKELYFQTSCLEAIQGEINTPGHYYTFPEFTITEYKNWREVVDWALPLYPFNERNPEVLKKVNELSLKAKSDHEEVTNIIRFVQDEIRYLGFEVGENSHKPSKPESVLKRRFGDCKDKSYLLCAMLNMKDYQAIPVLVHSERKVGLADELPSPLQFNHVVVRFMFKGEYYFVDPTISYQRGVLSALQFPDYHEGLFINPGNNSLAMIPGNFIISKSEFEEHFEVIDSIQPIKLKVISKYTGRDADRMRYYFASESRDYIEKEYLKFYNNLYGNVKIDKSLVLTDNENQNVILVEENYELSKQWKFDTKDELMSFEVYPQLILTQLAFPESRTRNTPYSINYPLNAKLTMFIKLPEEWPITEQNERIIDNNFNFYFNSANSAKNTVKLIYGFETRYHTVLPNAMEKFYSNLEKMNNYSAYVFTWGGGESDSQVLDSSIGGSPKSSGFKWNLLMIVLSYIVFGAMFFAFKNWYKWDKIPECEVEFAQPIGGWLILLALSLFLTPIVNIYNIVDGQYYNQNIWNAINDSSSPGYNENLPGYFLLELLFRLVLIPLNIFNILLFLERRTSFPRFQIISSIFILAFSLFELNMIFLLNSEDSAANEEVYYGLIRSLIGASIWILYLLKSERVRSTFVFTYDKSKEKHYVEGKMPD